MINSTLTYIFLNNLIFINKKQLDIYKRNQFESSVVIIAYLILASL